MDENKEENKVDVSIVYRDSVPFGNRAQRLEFLKEKFNTVAGTLKAFDAKMDLDGIIHLENRAPVRMPEEKYDALAQAVEKKGFSLSRDPALRIF